MKLRPTTGPNVAQTVSVSRCSLASTRAMLPAAQASPASTTASPRHLVTAASPGGGVSRSADGAARQARAGVPRVQRRAVGIGVVALRGDVRVVVGVGVHDHGAAV